MHSIKKSGFYAILFHALYTEDERYKQKHPYLFISVDEFESCIDILLDSGLNFLDPAKPFCAQDNKKIKGRFQN